MTDQDGFLEVVENAFAKAAETAGRNAILLEGSSPSVAYFAAEALGLLPDLSNTFVYTGPPYRLDSRQKALVRSAYHQALSAGLVAPWVSDHDVQDVRELQRIRFIFTEKGVSYYLGEAGALSLIRASALVEALDRLKGRRPTAVESGQRALLGEAHLCWRQGCFRAAMVLVGVASEDSIGSLLDVLARYPARSKAAAPDWKTIDNPNAAMATRFAAGLGILRRLERELRTQSNKLKSAPSPQLLPAWSALWFRSVDPLSAFGEANRYARNRAAHDAEAEFRRSDVGLLLASMPTLLEHVDELRGFLTDPAAALAPILTPEV